MSENYPEPDPRLAQSKMIQSLRDEPRFKSEFPGGYQNISVEQRQYVARLRLPRNGPAAEHGSGNGEKTVYHLYGDERRAVRKLIERYPDYFRDVLGGEYGSKTVLTGSWGDGLVQMAVEEYAFHEAQAGGES